jgi:uncharacterized protein
MASSYKTPGVFVEEIPKLPPSVAQVETAIPAFIGYTEKAERNGENLSKKPTRITAFNEFEAYFGGAYEFAPGDLTVKLDEGNNFAVQSVAFAKKSFLLYDAMRLFYDNGGGPCYVVSVGTYAATSFSSGMLPNSTALKGGLDEVEKYDEPTLLVIPDAVNLAEDPFYSLQQAALVQCGKLQDRFAILDLREAGVTNWSDAPDKFRDKIGISNLKYGAAYAPWVYTTYTKTVPYRLIRNTTGNDIILNSAGNALDLAGLGTPEQNELVQAVKIATGDAEIIAGDIDTLRGAEFKTPEDKYRKLKSEVLAATPANTSAAFVLLFEFVRSVADVFPLWRRPDSTSKRFKNDSLVKTLDALAKNETTGLRKFMKDLIALEKNTDVDNILPGAQKDFATGATGFDGVPAAGAESWLGMAVAGVAAAATDFGNTAAGATPEEIRTAVLAILPVIDPIFNGLKGFLDGVQSAAGTYQSLAQDALYSRHPIVANIVKSIQKQLAKMPPSSAVAGVYARVDSARGVWKAPANESLASVSEPVFQVTAERQGGLNVDPVAGKSINAIRTFTGKGTLIWGARTLAGNDNEWRYVNVRRFFNMVEESSKKATEPFVFESNDANTWVKVQGMIENYLTILWREGALQGEKPEHAFYVAVGLGKTMISQDILEGRMIVEIGMAAVRPAEFIILRFSHLLAKS